MKQPVRRTLNKTFLCSYRFDGGEWAFQISAKDFEEAFQRIAALKFTAKVDGEHVAALPAGSGWFVKIITAVRNFFITRPEGRNGGEDER